jgi:hypothetical protein
MLFIMNYISLSGGTSDLAFLRSPFAAAGVAELQTAT